MSAIFILIILGTIVATGFVWACIWAIRQDQFDDLSTPAIRILFDSSNTSNEFPEHDL